MAHLFPIIERDSPAGSEPVLREPTVGRWYCGADKVEDDFGPLEFGLIGRYEGDGIFSDPAAAAGEDADEIQMTGYDVLVEQLGGA